MTQKTILTSALVLFLLSKGLAQTNELKEFSDSRSVQLQVINEEYALNYCFKAQNDFEKENYEAVIRSCTKALEINPSCSAAFRLRGYAQIKSDSTSSGCTDLRRAADLAGNSMWGKVIEKDINKYCKE